ncbi:MAG: hypothetical protein AAFP70_10210 [Calditrichota bacterium]
MRPIYSIGLLGGLILLLALLFSETAESDQQNITKRLVSTAIAADITQANFINQDTQPALLFTNRNRRSLLGNESSVAEQAIQTEGKLVKQVVSPQGNWFALAHMEMSKNSHITVSVYSSDGTQRYQLKRPNAIDMPIPGLHIDERDGSIVLSDAAEARLFFYGPSGTLLETIEIYENASYDLERVIDVSVAAETGQIAVAAGKHGASPAGSSAPNPDADPQLFLFNADRTLVWSRELPGYNLLSCVISPDGKFIAAGSYTVHTNKPMERVSSVIDMNGQIYYSNQRLFKNAAFSNDSRTLLLTENQHAQLIDLTTASQVWQKTIPRESGIILERAVHPQGKESALLLAKQTFKDNAFHFEKPSLLRLNKQGEAISTRGMESSPAGVIAIHYSPDGTFNLMLNNGLLIQARDE